MPPLIVHRQPPRQRPDLHARNGAALIAAHRIARDGQLRRDRLRAPPTIRQLTNRSHDLAFDHRHLRYGRYQNPLLSLHSTLLLRGSELVSQGGQYHCRSTTGCRRTLFLMSETICVPLCFFCGAIYSVFPCVSSAALPTLCSPVLLLWRYPPLVFSCVASVAATHACVPLCCFCGATRRSGSGPSDRSC